MTALFTTPKSLKQQALKIWQRGQLHRAWLQKQSIFPLSLPLKKLAAKTLLTHFSELQDNITALRQDSLKQGYTISDKIISHRQLGEQQIPISITFTTADIFLNYLTKTAEYIQFQQLSTQTLKQDTLLLQWLIRYPFKLMRYADVWPQLLAVCAYFDTRPKPDCYIRQLDIKGVDSKFIEQHKSILNELLSQMLANTDYHVGITGLSNHGFERRYGLRYDQPLVRCRILDTRLAINGLTDLTLTVSEFKNLNITAKTVFIAENKVNGLAFPDYSSAIVIFGLGYAVNLLVDVLCLKQATLFYWGDIDTHGFAILSRLRHYYPQAQSLLMDKQTLEKFAHLCVDEDKASSEQKPLTHLTGPENCLYQQLQKSLRRLEQERISFSYLQKALSGINSD